MGFHEERITTTAEALTEITDEESDFPFHETSTALTGSFIQKWEQLSYGIGASLSQNIEKTVHSLINVPSDDRCSNGLLMGINLQTMILGTTMLSIPYSIKIAGAWAIVLMFVIGIMTNFTANIISDVQYQLSLSTPGFQKRVYVTFVDMSQACWNKSGRYVMEVLTYFSLARNVVVIILLTDVTNEILAMSNIEGYNKRAVSVLWTLALIPLLLIRKISVLAWISAVGLLLFFGALLAMFTVSCFSYSTWDISRIPLQFDLRGIGIATGIIINSYAVHMNLPSLEGSLAEPLVYHRTTTITFAINIFAKIAFAICCYLTYTDVTDVEISSNMNRYSPLPLLIRVAILFFSYFSVPLQSFVVFDLVDKTFKPHFPLLEGRTYSWSLLSRSLFMTFCLLIAVVVPRFGLVVSLLGSVRGSMIALILPACYFIKIQTHESKLHKKAACYFLIVIGMLSGAVGLYSSIAALLV